MIKRMSKVYVWNSAEKEMQTGFTGEYIIGEVHSIDVDFVNICSIIDGRIYRYHISEVYEVGTGPGVKNDNIVMEDYYV